MGPLLTGFVARRAAGIVIGLIALGGVVIGLAFAPDLAGRHNHKLYEPFFGGAAGVVSAIFIAMALQARYVTSSVSLAVATVAGLGLSALASVVALLPNLCQTQYSIAFAATVGGGIAGLTSVSIIAAGAFIEARDQRHRETLDQVSSGPKS